MSLYRIVTSSAPQHARDNHKARRRVSNRISVVARAARAPHRHKVIFARGERNALAVRHEAREMSRGGENCVNSGGREW